jgi:hypothetical protein
MGKELTSVQKSRLKLFENREWFDNNLHEIQKNYRGKVIAVYGLKIVADGDSSDEVYEKIKDEYPLEEVLVIMVPNEEILVVPYPV